MNPYKLIRNEIARATRREKLDFPAVLVQRTPGARTTGQSTSGTNPTPARHPVRGIAGSFRQRDIDGTVIRQNDRRILLIGKSLPAGIEPRTGDRIEIDGDKYGVLAASHDPARAGYVCHGR